MVARGGGDQDMLQSRALCFPVHLRARRRRLAAQVRLYQIGSDTPAIVVRPPPPPLPTVFPTRVPTVHSRPPSLLVSLPVSLLYTHSPPPYCFPYPCPYCTLTPSLTQVGRHEEAVTFIRFSRDAQFIYSSSSDGVRPLPTPLPLPLRITLLLLSPLFAYVRSETV